MQLLYWVTIAILVLFFLSFCYLLFKYQSLKESKAAELSRQFELLEKRAHLLELLLEFAYSAYPSHIPQMDEAKSLIETRIQALQDSSIYFPEIRVNLGTIANSIREAKLEKAKEVAALRINRFLK